MRPLEAALVLADAAAFALMAIGFRCRTRWLSRLVLVPLPVIGVQLLAEGARWEMVPAYALGVLFSLVGMLGTNMLAGRRGGQRGVRHLTVGLGIGLGMVALGIAVGLPLVLPVFGFPRPGGPYQIGTLTYHWVDPARREIFSTDPNARRELMAQLWYPVMSSTTPARSPYVPDAHAFSSAVTRGLAAAGQRQLPDFIFDHLRYVTTPAIPSAPMATDKPRFPVLIFLSGLGGYRQSNTFQVDELVSRGYVVVGLDQPYTAATVAFPNGRRTEGITKERMQPLIDQSTTPREPAPPLDGRPLNSGVVPYLSQDVSFTLDQLARLDRADPNGILTGRLDLHQVGAFGVSLGAIVVGEACHSEPRLKACLMMDAAMPADVVQSGLQRPGMWITRDAATMRLEHQRGGGWPESAIREALTSMRTVFAKSPQGHGYLVQVPGMFHPNFTDAPNLSPLAYQLGFSGPIDPQRGFDIVNAYSVAFFDQELQGHSTALLQETARQYPEVILETH